MWSWSAIGTIVNEELHVRVSGPAGGRVLRQLYVRPEGRRRRGLVGPATFTSTDRIFLSISSREYLFPLILIIYNKKILSTGNHSLLKQFCQLRRKLFAPNILRNHITDIINQICCWNILHLVFVGDIFRIKKIRPRHTFF